MCRATRVSGCSLADDGDQAVHRLLIGGDSQPHVTRLPDPPAEVGEDLQRRRMPGPEVPLQFPGDRGVRDARAVGVPGESAAQRDVFVGGGHQRVTGAERRPRLGGQSDEVGQRGVDEARLHPEARLVQPDGQRVRVRVAEAVLRLAPDLRQ